MPSNGMMMGGALSTSRIDDPKRTRDTGALVGQTNRARENANRLEALCATLNSAADRVYGTAPEPANSVEVGRPPVVVVGAIAELAAVNDRTDQLLNWLSMVSERLDGIA